MSINDGGQAFPCAGTLYPDGSVWDAGSNGMTLRDYFAAKAMQALIPLFSSGTLSVKDGTPATEAHVSEQAYAFADAMLAEREKENNDAAR